MSPSLDADTKRAVRLKSRRTALEWRLRSEPLSVGDLWLNVFIYPFKDQVGNLEIILVEHNHVAVAVDA